VSENALPRSFLEESGLQIDLTRLGALQEAQEVIGVAAQSFDAT
jgi:hypothetical protein